MHSHTIGEISFAAKREPQSSLVLGAGEDREYSAKEAP